MKKIHAIVASAVLLASGLIGLQVPAAQAANQTDAVDCSRQYFSTDNTSPNTDLNISLNAGDTLTLTNTTSSGNGQCNSIFTGIAASFYNFFTAWPISQSTSDVVFTVRGDSPNLASTRFAVFTSNIGSGATNGRQVYITINGLAGVKILNFAPNGGTGTVMPSQNSTSAAALVANTYVRAGYTFTGWNTAANGTGTAYAPGAVYPFAANGSLYAQWAVASKTVTFDANGGTGTMANQSSSAAANLTANSFTKSGSTFAGWNTLANGTGVTFADAASYTFAADVTLYAQWTSATPVAPVYEGPIVDKISPKSIDPTTSRLVTLTGSKLPLNCTITVGGQVVKAITSSAGVISFEVPADLTGYQPLSIVSSDKSYRFDSRVFVASALAVVPSVAGSKSSVTAFAAGASSLTAAMRNQLDALAVTLTSGNTVTCVGYTSGPVSAASDLVLAKRRAATVCGYLKQAVAGLTVSTSGQTDNRVGAAVRRVEVRITK